MLIHVLNAEVFENLLKIPRHLFAIREYKNLPYFGLALPLLQQNHLEALYCCVNESSCGTWKNAFSFFQVLSLRS